jgi:hypothetical protein
VTTAYRSCRLRHLLPPPKLSYFRTSFGDGCDDDDDGGDDAGEPRWPPGVTFPGSWRVSMPPTAGRRPTASCRDGRGHGGEERRCCHASSPSMTKPMPQPLPPPWRSLAYDGRRKALRLAVGSSPDAVGAAGDRRRRRHTSRANATWRTVGDRRHKRATRGWEWQLPKRRGTIAFSASETADSRGSAEDTKGKR